MKKLFKGFVNICDSLAKLCDDIDIVASDGIFMWKDNGIITIVTFAEKMEKEAIPFLTGKYIFNPHTIVLLSKYLEIQNIIRNDAGFKFIFPGQIPSELLADKDASIGLQKLRKEPNGAYSLRLENGINHNGYLQLEDAINNMCTKADFDKSETISELSNDTITGSERAIEMQIGNFFIRIAKSVFISINKADKLSIRCIPLHSTDSVFLVMTTNCKEKCKLINLFSALRL